MIAPPETGSFSTRVSESPASPRPTGGRPRLTTDTEKLKSWIRQGHCGDRTLLNRHRLERALKVLLGGPGPGPHFAWLGLSSADAPYKSMRRTVLYELGMIRSDEWLIAAAMEVCKAAPRTTREGMCLIRALRVHKVLPGSEWELCRRLNETIRDYKRTHPDMDGPTIKECLATVYQQTPGWTWADQLRRDELLSIGDE
jgi:hypothetical protein